MSEQQRQAGELERQNQALQLALADVRTRLETAMLRIQTLERRFENVLDGSASEHFGPELPLARPEPRAVRYRRKLAKLKRDPRQFFRDAGLVKGAAAGARAVYGSRSGPRIGSGQVGASRYRRKLAKLRRDPLQFFRDAQLVRVAGSLARSRHS